jgi:PAS domain S-box-containing protein
MNGSLVQFHNVFKSILPSGEMFTMDECMPCVDRGNLTLLVNTISSEVIQCDGSSSTLTGQVCVGMSLLDMISPDDVNNVIMALMNSSKGSCRYNLTTNLTSMATSVSLDFFPCTNETSVVVVSILPSVNCCNYYGISRQSSNEVKTNDSDELSTRHVYSMGRRLLDLNSEIKYLQDFRDNASLPMYSVSSKGRILWANDAMVSMMGFAGYPRLFIGSKACKYHVDEKLLATKFKMILEGQRQVEFECELRHRSGEIFNVSYISNAKFDNEGKFMYSRCIVQDVTEHKQLLSERDQMRKKQLDAEVKEKEATAASKTKSEFLAVMSHELRTPINGVLGATSLLGITTLNEEQRDYVNTITDSADILLSLISNILDISKIEKGKLELDKVPLRMVDMVHKCADMMKYRASEKGLTIATEIDPDLNDPNVWHHADPTRINQVLLNFLSNAVKFTHTGGVQCKLMKLCTTGKRNSVREMSLRNIVDDLVGDVTSSRTCGSPTAGSFKSIEFPTSIHSDDEPSQTRRSSSGSCARANYDWLRLEVIDTGCGIDDSSKLFAPFVQANKAVHKQYGGTGLGLNISKQIVELMRGRVGINSTEGVGTTVWAEIPMRRASAPRKGPDFFVLPSPFDVMGTKRKRMCYGRMSRPSIGVNNEDLTKKVRILIAEDNKVNQKVLKRMLETLGYTDITVTNNGQEAVDAVKASWEQYLMSPMSGRFDIVLMDCLMPVMDGWSATEAIRNMEIEYIQCAASKAAEFTVFLEAQPTIVLALTANATADDKKRCIACGMDDFFIKPMPRDRLNTMMLRWVSILFSDDTGSCESVDSGVSKNERDIAH